MALKLSKFLRDGGTVEYWRVAPFVHYDIENKTVGCQLMLYVNETARRADKPPVPIPNLETVEGLPAPSLKGDAAVTAMAAGDPRAAIYGLLKADPYFAGSEDV